MAEPLTFKMTGLAELQKKLEERPQRVIRKILRKALSAGGGIVRDMMAQMAPRGETGFLSANFDFKVRVARDNVSGTAFIGPKGKTYYPNVGSRDRGVSTGKYGKKGGALPVASVARFLEFGTSKMPARPFMRPAFAASGRQALDKIIEVLRELVAEMVK